MNDTTRSAGSQDGKQIKVFLMDDHEIVRRGVRELLETEPDIVVIGEAGDRGGGAGPHPRAAPRTWPCWTCACPTATVSACAGTSARPCRSVACLMLTSFADDEALFDAIMAGAAGYVLKQIRGTDLVGAVRTVAAGGSLLDPEARRARSWRACGTRRPARTRWPG